MSKIHKYVYTRAVMCEYNAHTRHILYSLLIVPQKTDQISSQGIYTSWGTPQLIDVTYFVETEQLLEAEMN